MNIFQIIHIISWVCLFSPNTFVLTDHIAAGSTPTEASVALLDCSQKYPNVYFDVLRRDWLVHSTDTKCYTTDQDLLELCKSVYPGLKVTNILRQPQATKFTLYACNEDSQQPPTLSLATNQGCRKVLRKKVTPYKCLYGEYKSQDLAVPPKCEFMHLYSNDECQSQDHWSLLASEKCRSSGQTMNASSLLKWCDGVGTFKGIEFVCCPNVARGFDFVDVKKEEDEDIDDDYGDDDFGYDYVRPEGEEVKKLDNMKEDMDKLNANEFIATFNKVKVIVDALDVAAEEKEDMEAVEGTKEQKEQYEKQKNFIIMSIQNSTEKLIKEKQTTVFYLTQSNDNKKSADSLFYEPMLRNLDNQYQVRFDRLNKEKDRLLLQEEISYEQQVQGRLNEKKLSTLKELNSAMQDQSSKPDSQVDLEQLVKAVNNFYMAQEHDRLHMISVYKKLKAYFPEQIFQRAQSIINHLNSIDATLDETTSVFMTKFKFLSKSVLPLVREHLKRYDQVKTESKTIRLDLKNLSMNYIATDLKTTTTKQQLSSSLVTNSENTNIEYYNDVNNNNDFDEDKFEDDDYMYYEDGEVDDYEPVAVDQTRNEKKLSGQDINITRVESKERNVSALVVLLAVLLGVFVSLLLVVCLIRRKKRMSSSTSSIVKHGFLPVETSNPEERHINAMQTNGYENPTYKYFEATAQA